MELAASWRSSSRVKACSVCASRYSLATSEQKARIIQIDHPAGGYVEGPAAGVSGEKWANAGADVGGGIQLQRGAPHFQLLDKVRVLNSRERMAEPLGADGESFADRFGRGGLAGMVGEAQAGSACFGIEGTKRLGAALPLVAPKADAVIEGILRQLDGLRRAAFGFGHGEVTDDDRGSGRPRPADLALAAFAVALQRSSKIDLKRARVMVAPYR